MSLESVVVPSPQAVTVIMPEMPALDATLRPEALATPTAEQIRAVETAFAPTEENTLVAGIMGMWTGNLLLHDLAAEALRTRFGRDWDARIVAEPAPLRSSAGGGGVIAEYWIRHGTIARASP